ncbi:MAG: hypothetical protein FWF33_00665 [Clostridiales bacterium]|nr:hypothetical protein [Clostridiales bacterium]
MNERENMQLVWEHKTPEWVPMLGTESQLIPLPEINDRSLFEDGTDWFGVKWELDPNQPLLMTHVVTGHPVFTDISRWREYLHFPAASELPWDAMKARTDMIWHDRDERMGYVVCAIGAFERVNAVMGFEDGLMALYDDIGAYKDLVNAYADYRIDQFGYYKKYLAPDFLMMHDDWGNQKNMFLSPELWREIFKEPERRMAAAAHDLGIYYMHHSCGYIEPIIPDLVEVGIDSWHSVSPVNNLAKIKAEFGDRLIFAGGVDPQVTDLPGVPEEEIRAEVRRAIDVLGKGGGYLCGSAVMQSTVAGVDAIIEDEGRKYGRYPTSAEDLISASQRSES